MQIDMDYRTVGKNRDISLGLVGDVGAILAAVTAGGAGRVDNGARAARALARRAARGGEIDCAEERLPAAA